MASATDAVRLPVLCDDTAASEAYLAEHGVSILVESANGQRWLMDTGTTDVFLRNAPRWSCPWGPDG
jgi:7,8-dihydropterin-6-yl-methyl-4-(beta-D-ribofuranosyl)aminobenzene 5'-phosphate synthase